MGTPSLEGNKQNWTEWVELWSANELFQDGYFHTQLPEQMIKFLEVEH